MPVSRLTYGLDGALCERPQMDEAAGSTRATTRCGPVACETWDGHISSNLSSAPRPLLEQVHGLPERFAPWGMQDLRMVHRIQYDVATNWKLVVQNYNECLHCPVIHPLLNRMHHYLGAENVPSTETTAVAPWASRRASRRSAATASGAGRCCLGLGARAGAGQLLRDLSQLPADAAPDYMMTITIWPESPGRTKLIASGISTRTRSRSPGLSTRTPSSSGTAPSRRLGHLGAVVPGHQLTRLPARTLLGPRAAIVGVRPVRREETEPRSTRRSRRIIGLRVFRVHRGCYLIQPEYNSGRRCFMKRRRAFELAVATRSMSQ